jgi:uncharacterized Zn-finger protein
MAVPPPPEVIYVDTLTVGCDGGGALGHPLVYLTLGEDGQIECGYCDRMFKLRSTAHPVAEESGPGTPLASPARTEQSH